MLLLNVVKFVHVVLALGLIGVTAYSIGLAGFKKLAALSKSNKILLWLSLIAMLTGTLLVLPKHYTFHTAWIRAAYLLMVIYLSGIVVLNFKKKIQSARLNQFIYLILLVLLIMVAHDAIRKTTLFTALSS